MVGKRSQFIDKSDNFFGIWDVIPNYTKEFKDIQSYCDKYNCSARLYGELYGDGIQKRVKYGPKKLCFFDIEINDGLLSQGEFEIILTVFGLYKSAPPLIEYAVGLEKALKVSNTFNSRILNEEDNIAEGVVIKPMLSEYTGFVLKNKSDKFSETGKIKPNKIDLSQDEINLQNAFSDYINDSRLDNIASKLGEIKKEKIGEFIKVLVNDALNDFLKDFGPIDNKFLKAGKKKAAKLVLMRR